MAVSWYRWYQDVGIRQFYQLYHNMEFAHVYFSQLFMAKTWIMKWSNKLSEVSTDICPLMSTILKAANPPPSVVSWSQESRFDFEKYGQIKQTWFWISSGLMKEGIYRKISTIRRTKSSNLIVSRLVLQLSLLNPLKPGVKSIMKM